MQDQQQEQRKSTDLICFWCFSIFQAFFFCITIYEILNGNPAKLGLPYDPDHLSCGFDLEEFKYIYFTTPSNNFLFRTVCLSECPKNQQISKLQCSPNSIVKSCQINPSVTNISESVLSYPSEIYNSQICLPNNPDYLNEIKELIVPSTNQNIGSGLRDLKWIILGVSLISIIISVIVLLFIEKYSTQIFWGYFAIIVLSLFSLCLFSLQLYYKTEYLLEMDKQLQVNQIIAFANSLQISEELYQVFIIISIIAVILCIIYAIYLKQYTKLLNLFLKVGGDFIKSNITSIIAPCVGACIILLYSFIWIQQQLYLLSNLTVQNSKYPYLQINLMSQDQAFIIINTIIYIWTIMFIIGLTEYFISGMVCEWYFQQGNRVNFQKKNILLDLVQYHLGSIALGSILISIFQYIKWILKATKICQGFYNRIILAISKHNYVIMHIQPNHFLDSGIVSRELIIKEIDTYNKIGELGQAFLEISRLSLGLCCQSICMAIIQDHPYSIILSLYCFVISYSITSLFMSLYGQTSEAIYMLYLYSQKHLTQEDNPQCTITLQLVFNQLNEDNNHQIQ
ncbi:unnamed protein product [Paramecium sonneborni]|uniref:Choline transporter-like protein n=1 Tax=Paramecium sonneborni TaxID=65129 RepID=A0A8S1PLK7_9CILI|nr:unnamed protein product [Paramecium sonneborni]